MITLQESKIVERVSPTMLYEQLTHEERKELITVVDVRKTDQDFPGGHIRGAVNYAYDDIDADKLMDMMDRYCDSHWMVFHCMYSQVRGVRASDWYCRALNHILFAEPFAFDKIAQKKFEDSEGFMSTLDECAKRMSEEQKRKLKEQRIVLLSGGFRTFLNTFIDDEQRKHIIEDFDESKWTLRDPYGTDQPQLYHNHDWHAGEMDLCCCCVM